MSDPDRLRRALAAIDAANADDPNTLRVRGVSRPKEQAHAELASDWVEKLAPGASDALRLAARAHHVRRWTIPRSDYPEGRAGYHRWRNALQAVHAATARDILEREGFEPETVERVEALIRKRGLGRDPEVQVLEDALCLVFVETQLADLASRLDPEKLEDVVRKTLRKMSPEAIAAAAELPIAEPHRALLLRIASE